MVGLCCSMLVTIVSGLVSSLELMRKEVMGSIHLGVSWLSYKEKAFTMLLAQHLVNLCIFRTNWENGWLRQTIISSKDKTHTSTFPWFEDISNYIIIRSRNVDGQETRTKLCHELACCVTLCKSFGFSESVFSLNKR